MGKNGNDGIELVRNNYGLNLERTKNRIWLVMQVMDKLHTDLQSNEDKVSDIVLMSVKSVYQTLEDEFLHLSRYMEDR